MRALRDPEEAALAEDEPDAPAYVRDRTPLRKGQMTTLALREEFRRNPSLPMPVGDDIFIRGIRRGIEQATTSTGGATCCSVPATRRPTSASTSRPSS